MATRGGKQRNKQHRDARRSALVVVARRSTLLPLMASGNEKNRALLLLPYSRLRTRAAEGNRNENWSSLFYRAARAQSCPDCSTLLLPLLAFTHARPCLQLQAFARCYHHAPKTGGFSWRRNEEEAAGSAQRKSSQGEAARIRGALVAERRTREEAGLFVVARPPSSSLSLVTLCSVSYTTPRPATLIDPNGMLSSPLLLASWVVARHASSGSCSVAAHLSLSLSLSLCV